MSWTGQERRVRFQISGPFGTKVTLVGGGSIIIFIVGMIFGYLLR